MAQQLPSLPETEMTTRLKVRIRELSILHEIARAVTSILDLQSVLTRIVEAAVYLTNAEEGFIMMVDEDSAQLHLRAGKGLGDKAAKVMSMPVQDSLAGQVVETGKPLRMGGTQQTDSYKVKTGYLVKSLLNVPIKGHNRILGVLSVDHAMESMKTFSDHDVGLLTNLAEYAAIAIENAQRYEEASRRADELAKALQEYNAVPEMPSRAADKEALQKFNQGLRNQRHEITNVQEWISGFAGELKNKSKAVEEIAHRLGLWNEEVDGLLPQLDWIAQTGLAKDDPTRQVDTPPDNALISTLKTLLKHLPVGVLLCDVKGRILEAGGAAAEILNRAPQELIGNSLSIIAPEDTRWEHLISSMRLALALGKREKSMPPPAGVTLYLDTKIIKASLAPTGIHESNGVAMVVYLKDTTAEASGWHARDESLIALSENLRSPMAAISSYADLLISESVGLITRGQKRYLHRIRHSVDVMEDRLVKVTSRPSYIPAAADVSDTTLPEAIEKAVKSAEEELTLNDVLLAANIPPSLPCVQISTEYFTKLVTDLILRAGAHSQPQETLELTAAAQEENQIPAYLIISIGNQSPHPYIKETLEADQSLKTITKVVEYQGGRIWTDIDYAGRWVISFLMPAII